MKRRNHYLVVRLYWAPTFRVYRPGDFWQCKLWDVELGAKL